MSLKTHKEIRTWIIPGIESHVVTVEWTRRRWTPPESVVRVDDEIVSKGTFRRRHLHYGVHAFHLDTLSSEEIVLKYHPHNGYYLYLNGETISPINEDQISNSNSPAWGLLTLGNRI